MASKDDEHYYRVVCSSGDVFYTSAKSAVEFVLDPVFIQFMVLSVILFSALMLAIGLPAIPQVIIFGAGIVSTFVWLSLMITVYLWVLGLFGGRTIFTPILLVPMQILNGLIMDQFLDLFGTGYIEGFGFWEITIRTFVIIVCLDIIHGKYVAVFHGRTVALDANSRIVRPASPNDGGPDSADNDLTLPPRLDTTPAPLVNSEEGAAVISGPDTTLNSTQSVPLDQPGSPSDQEVVVGSKKFKVSQIRWIKSEDHYLLIHLGDRSEMLRGRLGTVVANIAPPWGVQINRSVWVSFAAIAEVNENANGQVEVVLCDGTVLKVANSRKILFEHGCAQYAPSLERQRGST